MGRNEKGIADWILVVSMASSLLLFAGCALLPNFWKTPSGPSNLPKDHYAQTEQILTEPVVTTVTAPYSGEQVQVNIGQRVSKNYSKVVDRTPAKVSVWVKLWGIFGFWIIVIGAVIIFVPGAMSVFLLMMAQAKGSLSQAFGQTTRGIEKFLQSEQDEAAKKKLKTSLSEEMSDDTKIMVTKSKKGRDPVK